MDYDCEMIYTADNFCLVRVGSFIVLLQQSAQGLTVWSGCDEPQACYSGKLNPQHA